MKIIVDAFGGDLAPLEILKGCVEGRRACGVDILLTGDERRLRACAEENRLDISKLEIKHAPSVIEATDPPTEILRSKSDSSMAAGLRALAEGEGDAFISAGSTGALLIGGTFIVKRIRGVKRAALSAVLPSSARPFLLIDTGANVECTAPMLRQFAVLGNAYMKKVMGIKEPQTALANIGTEPTKGTPLLVEAHRLLSKARGIGFTGNIEVRDIAFGRADVVVADGFTGNVIVKMYEGVAKALTGRFRTIFKKNMLSRLSYLGVKSDMDEFKELMDYKSYGGAPLAGLRKPVFKAHGSSDAGAILSVIRQTRAFVEKGVIDGIEGELLAFGETEKREVNAFGKGRRPEKDAAGQEMDELQKEIGYRFKNTELLRRAVTHSSYANENHLDGDNERLEFLGDSVLGFITAEYLFSHHRELPEGELTKLRAYAVCEQSLYGYARKIRLGEKLRLGRGEENTGGRERPSVLSNAFEALIAAVYLDGGLEPAKKFVLRFVSPYVETKPTFKDYKTLLQEVVQKNQGESPKYVLLSESGPDHDKNFRVAVRLNGSVIGIGGGGSKKKAEQEAAKDALGGKRFRRKQGPCQKSDFSVK